MTEASTIPAPRTVYLTLAGIFLLQLPSALLLAHDHLRWGILTGQMIGIALPLTLLVGWRGYDIRRLFPRHRPAARHIAIVCILTLLVAMASDLLVTWIDRFWNPPFTYKEGLRRIVAVHSPAEGIEKFLLLCVLPAVIEEACFRGFCQTSLTQAYGPRIAILITALAFAAAHPNPWYFPVYVLLGLYLGTLYRWKGTLWLPVTAHFVNNTWTFVTISGGWQLPGG